MANPHVAPSANGQRKKIVVSILLSGVLVAILGARFLSQESGATSTEPPPTGHHEAGPPPAAITPAGRQALAANSATRWPEVDLRRITTRNPFRGLRGLQDEPAASRNDESNRSRDSRFSEFLSGLAPPRKSPTSSQPLAANAASSASAPPLPSVSAIVTGGGRPWALIGDKLVHEDDLVDERWRIVAIRASGVVIEPAQESVGKSEP